MSTTRSDAAADTHKPTRDVRGFWRILLAVIAPLPMLANGIYYLFSPTNGGVPFEEDLAAATTHGDRIALLEWIQVPFVSLMIPATFAVVWVARRGAPRLTTAGALIALTGFCAGFGNLPGTVSSARITVEEGLDPATVSKLTTALNEHLITQLSGLLFILGVTFGLLLLGLALWRSRVAPAWMGIALAVGGFTHPFLRDHVIAGIGLLIAAVGFAGASYALLRTRNEDFDLPAR
ncbi:hypothetical protein [Kribbella sp. CA-294648]|uniref:hypothetical protein n=1 Tax=Kribbella sp. CA-294648 TaxID=3239948 RepID=UPI003D8B9E4E